MAKRTGLGSGLESIFQNTGSTPVDVETNTLRIADIEPDKNQPRKYFEDGALNELASSIMEHGILQPIAVRQTPSGGYTIIAGERRWRAARMAGLTEIPVVIKDVSAEEAMELALIENLQREDLDAVEEALGYKQLMDMWNYTQEKLASRLAKSRSAIANSMRILTLPESILSNVRDNTITPGHAKAILSLKDKATQINAAEEIMANALNVRQAEILCKKLAKEPKQRPYVQKPALPTEVECSLKELLGAEVKVQYAEGKGSLNISFYSDQQLKAYANLLGKYEKEN